MRKQKSRYELKQVVADLAEVIWNDVILKKLGVNC